MRCAFALLILALAACDGRDRRSDLRIRDVGPRVDSGVSGGTDANGSLDGSEPLDGSDPFDGSEPPDGSAPADANDQSDAGGPRDATTPDSGPADSGLPPLCTQTCTVPADCALDNGLQDADNWLCTGGACEYLGCIDAQECISVYGQGYVCVQHPGYPVPSCVPACSTPADCVVPSPLFDEDNYECNGGGCRWGGCNDASECQAAFNDASYVCEMQAGLPFPNCIRPCSTPTDCGSMTPAFDADNYSCTGARCQYLGCTATAECEDSFQTGTWECR